APDARPDNLREGCDKLGVDRIDVTGDQVLLTIWRIKKAELACNIVATGHKSSWVWDMLQGVGAYDTVESTQIAGFEHIPHNIINSRILVAYISFIIGYMIDGRKRRGPSKKLIHCVIKKCSTSARSRSDVEY